MAAGVIALTKGRVTIAAVAIVRIVEFMVLFY